MPELPDVLRGLVARAGHWTEVRYHNRRSRGLTVRQGEVVDMSAKHYEGEGIRVLIDGTWGFAATSDLDPAALERALVQAEVMARALSSRKEKRIRLADTPNLARGAFTVRVRK